VEGEEMTEFSIVSDLDIIEETVVRILSVIENDLPRSELQYDIRLILSEIMINAHLHGNKQQVGKKIHIGFSVTESAFSIRIRDEGEGFDPCLVPNPLSLENLEKPSGRGLFLVNQIAQQIIFHGLGNDIEIIKEF
jgi:serine/threonine-protein kinase RsbW